MSTPLKCTPESIAKIENKNSKGKKSLLKKLFKFGKDKKHLKVEDGENEKSVKTPGRHLLSKNEFYDSKIEKPYLENKEMFSNGKCSPTHEHQRKNDETGIDPKKILIDFTSPFKNKNDLDTKKCILSKNKLFVSKSCSKEKPSQKIDDSINTEKNLKTNYQAEIIKNEKYNSQNIIKQNKSLFVYSLNKEVCNGINKNNNNNNMNDSFEENITNKFSNHLDISGNPFGKEIAANGVSSHDNNSFSNMHNTDTNQVPYVKIDLVTLNNLLSELAQCKRQLAELKNLLNET